MQDGYRSNAYLTISVRDKTRITCEALKAMSTTELSKLWKVSLSVQRLSLLQELQAMYNRRIDNLFDKLFCVWCCSGLDAASGFHQTLLRDELKTSMLFDPHWLHFWYTVL